MKLHYVESVNFTHADFHALRSAEGWLELGNHQEADAELDKLPPEILALPPVLKIRWQIYSRAKRWDTCVDIAQGLVRDAPDDSFGWIHLSYALHELHQTKAAWDNLLFVVEKFPKEWLIPYNLACYACQLGNLQESWQWFEKAITRSGDAKDIRLQALADPDLEPLWARIGKSP